MISEEDLDREPVGTIIIFPSPTFPVLTKKVGKKWNMSDPEGVLPEDSAVISGIVMMWIEETDGVYHLS